MTTNRQPFEHAHQETMGCPSDEVLMERVKAGAAAAFDLLVERHGKPLFNFILRFVGDVTDAEDLLQTTFVKILQSANSFDSRQKFTTWAFRIANNLCVDHWRRSQYRHAISLSEPLHDESTTTIGDSIEDGEALPFKRFEEKQLHHQIRRAIHTLPAEQRAVVILCHYKGLSYADISETLGIPVGTVKSRMHNAMLRLREDLKEWA